MARQRSFLSDFRGGINTDTATDLLSPSELRKAVNVDLSLRGGCTLRPGTEKINASSYEGKVTQVFEWARDDGTQQLMKVIDQNLCKVSSTGIATVVQAVDSDRVDYCSLQDTLYYVDGEAYRTYDGTSTSSMSGHQLSISVLAGGDLPAGDYRCLVTFKNSAGVETVASEIAEVTVPENSFLEWTSFPEHLSDTVETILYRTDPTYVDTEAFFRIGDLRWRSRRGYNPSTTYTDNRIWSFDTDGFAPRGARGANRPDPLAIVDLDSTTEMVENSKFIVRHTRSHRIFMAGNPTDQAALFYSEPNDPSTFKATSKMYPTTADGPITALATFVDAVVVFYENSIWVWRGLDPEYDAVWQKLPTSVGTTAPWSVASTTNALTYLGRGGLYALSPSIIGYSTEVNVDKSLVNNLAENKVTTIAMSVKDSEKAVGMFDPKNRRFLLAFHSEGDDNDTLLVYDEGLQSFVTWEGFPVHDLCYRRNGEMVVASDNYLLRFNEGTLDVDVTTGNTKSIPVEIEGQYSFGTPFTRKLFTRAWVSVQGFSLGELGFQLELDGVAAMDKALDIDNQGELVVLRKRFRELGKQIVFNLTHTETTGFLLYGVGFEYKPVRTYAKRV